MHFSVKIIKTSLLKRFPIKILTKKYHEQMDSLTMLRNSYFNEILPFKSEKYLSQLNSLNYSVYTGIDPSANSLHVGNLIALMGLLRHQLSGKDAIVVVGGGTATVGDPSGRISKRTSQSRAQYVENTLAIEETIKCIFANYRDYFVPNFQCRSPLGSMQILNNYDWLETLTCSNFVSQIATHFRIPELLDKESVKLRLKSGNGLDLSEFLYPILQAVDFLHLYENHHCRMQIGGHDQLGNITCGINLIKRKFRQNAFGLTVPLLTAPDGSKWGKSNIGAGASPIWLSQHRLIPYNFYQCLLNLQDTYVSPQLLRQLTFLSAQEIEALMREHEQFPERRPVQKTIARELTLLVHGADALQAAQLASRIFYPTSGGLQASSSSLSTLTEGLSLTERNFLIDCLSRTDNCTLPVLTVCPHQFNQGQRSDHLQTAFVDLLHQAYCDLSDTPTLQEVVSKGVVFNDLVLAKPGTMVTCDRKAMSQSHAQGEGGEAIADIPCFPTNLFREAFGRCDPSTGIGVLKIGILPALLPKKLIQHEVPLISLIRILPALHPINPVLPEVPSTSWTPIIPAPLPPKIPILSNTSHSRKSTPHSKMSSDEDEILEMGEVFESIDEENAIVMGGIDNRQICSFTKGYMKRQAVYTCSTCLDISKVKAGFCYPCSVNCHAGHDVLELYTKRNFRCDCGNSNFGASFNCQLWEEKDDINSENVYNDNFSNIYCTCRRPYPDESYEGDEDMIQCGICEDWFHPEVMYKELGVQFLLNPQDTMAYYLNLGKQRVEELDNEASEQLNKAMSEMPRDVAVNVATAIGEVKKAIEDFFNQERDEDHVITAEEVKSFFEKLRQKRSSM